MEDALKGRRFHRKRPIRIHRFVKGNHLSAKSLNLSNADAIIRGLCAPMICDRVRDIRAIAAVLDQADYDSNEGILITEDSPKCRRLEY